MLFKLQYVLGHQVFLLINLTDACHSARLRLQPQSIMHGMGPRRVASQRQILQVMHASKIDTIK